MPGSLPCGQIAVGVCLIWRNNPVGPLQRILSAARVAALGRLVTPRIRRLYGFGNPQLSIMPPEVDCCQSDKYYSMSYLFSRTSYALTRNYGQILGGGELLSIRAVISTAAISCTFEPLAAHRSVFVSSDAGDLGSLNNMKLPTSS